MVDDVVRFGVSDEVGGLFEGGAKLVESCNRGLVEGDEVVVGARDAAADLGVQRWESGFEIGFGPARLEFDQKVVADKDGDSTGLDVVRGIGGGGLFSAKEGIFE